MNSFQLSGLGCDCNQPMMKVQRGGLSGLRGVGETFNAGEILGKSLVAKTTIPVKDSPLDNGKVLYTVPSGSTVGVVYSYINPKTGQSVLNWQVDIPNPSNPAVRKYGYVAHGVGKFDVKNLIIQGAESTDQKYKDEQDAKAKAADPVGYYLKKFGLPVLVIGGGIYLAATLGKAVIMKKL
jgi:hypothetical protein